MSIDHDSLAARVQVIEDLLGITAAVRGDAERSRIKAIIKRGSSDFFNNVSRNPFAGDAQLSEWWEFGYRYAAELDADTGRTPA